MSEASTAVPTSEFARDVARGLGSSPKVLYAKYFYDELGSELFEAITEQPEYYPTRTEASILRRHAATIGELVGDAISLVELGSGSSVKTTILLENLLEDREALHYLPIDISPTILKDTAKRLEARYPELDVTPIASQYETGLEKASALVAENDSVPDHMLVLFLGSSIGNMQQDHALEFLTQIRDALSEKDALLVGFDLVKDRKVLNAAYNDACGVTARFNLNILTRINRELGGEFELDRFRHRALFNEEASRMEMHLVSEGSQDIAVGALETSFHFEPEETIHTESSYKYTFEKIESYADRAGFRTPEIFTDDKNWFALALFTPA